MRLDRYHYILIGVSFFMLVFFVFVYQLQVYKYESLYRDYNSLQSAYDLLQEKYRNVSQLYSALSERYDELNLEYTDLLSEYNALQYDYNRLYNEFMSLRDEVDYVYHWIHDNTTYFLTESFPYDVFKDRYGSVYFDYTLYVFEKNFQYQDDFLNHLRSPAEFEGNRGGDCEDWAFYFYFLVKHMLSQGYGIVIAQPSPGSQYMLRDGWYYEDYRPYYVDFPLVKDVYVVCGDVNSYDSPGHCVDYIEFVNGRGIYVEPQGGYIISDPFLPPEENNPCTGEWLKCSDEVCVVCGVDIFKLVPWDSRLNTMVAQIGT